MGHGPAQDWVLDVLRLLGPIQCHSGAEPSANWEGKATPLIFLGQL